MTLGFVTFGGCGDPASNKTAGPSDVLPVVVPGGSVRDGAGPGEKSSASITVAAAADLRTVLTAMKPDLERTCTTQITFVFGSSGQLKNQIEAGAGFGLFLSADSQYPRDLARAGGVVPNGVASYGVGRLVLATRQGLAPVTSIEQLSRPDIKRIAIANPDHAPYGRAAKQALENAGVYGAIKGKLVLGENIRQTTDYVEKGDADAALVALALVIQGSPASYTLIDGALHQSIEQGGAVIKGTGAELTGRCILQYVLDPAGQEALKRFGFEAAMR
ncbi:MAG: molybdate ABC transporter substrate-binding protein [Anaerolineaceae bacterium]